MGEIVKDLRDSDDALRYRLRERKADDTAFLLAVDQFEELFTFADPDERGRFDRLLATALEDADCPLFVISTVRADFLDRFDDLPRLVAVRNRLGRPWTLPPIGADGLREIIDGPARLAGLDVGAVREAMVAEARDEPGALPLVENALHWLWTRRDNGRLSGELFTENGGLAGILSRNADRLLDGLDPRERDRALESPVPHGPGGPGGSPSHPPAHRVRRGRGCRRRRRARPGPDQPPGRRARPRWGTDRRSLAADHRHRGGGGRERGPA